MKISKIPFHSILFSIYPIVNIYAQNTMFIQFGDIVPSLLISIGLVFLLLIGFRLILKSWEKAGAICSLLVIMFFSFGHFVNILAKLFTTYPITSLITVILTWLWLFIFLLLTYFLIGPHFPKISTLFLNVTGMVLLIFPLIPIISAAVSGWLYVNQLGKDGLSDLRGEKEAERSMYELSENEMPDIYYIILDSYERTDILASLYGYDNSDFIDALEKRGFFVASLSRSNYLNTTYSLNTSLNMLYFHEFPKSVMKSARYDLQTNYVSDFLRRQGYKVVVYDSGTGDSNNQYKDVFITPISNQENNKALLNPFEILLLRTTIGSFSFKVETNNTQAEIIEQVSASTVNKELNIRRDRITHAFSHLPDFADEEGPHFLFAHIYLPHIPFLYGPGGEELRYEKNMSFYWYEPLPENYIEQYIYQIEYENQLVINTIDRILEMSNKPVVIILQSDHGDDFFLDWYAPTTRGVDARSAILNAIYFSDRSYAGFYEAITPVNTFRIIFNHWFGTKYTLLPDKTFFHPHPLMNSRNTLPDFLDACDAFDICLPDQRRK